MDVGEDAGWVGDQTLAADEVQLIGAELCQPAADVNGVQTYLYRTPGCVHRRVTGAAVCRGEGELFECRRWHHAASLDARLGVVRHGSRHWISQHDDKMNVCRHLPHTTRHVRRYQVARSLFDRQLSVACHRHPTPVQCISNHNNLQIHVQILATLGSLSTIHSYRRPRVQLSVT